MQCHTCIPTAYTSVKKTNNSTHTHICLYREILLSNENFNEEEEKLKFSLITKKAREPSVCRKNKETIEMLRAKIAQNKSWLKTTT